MSVELSPHTMRFHQMQQCLFMPWAGLPCYGLFVQCRSRARLSRTRVLNWKQEDVASYLSKFTKRCMKSCLGDSESSRRGWCNFVHVTVCVQGFSDIRYAWAAEPKAKEYLAKPGKQFSELTCCANQSWEVKIKMIAYHWHEWSCLQMMAKFAQIGCWRGRPHKLTLKFLRR